MYKIAITGQANTGKNTLSRMLVKELRKTKGNYLGASYLAFADPIKEMVSVMFPQIPKKHLYGSSEFRKEIIKGAIDKDGNPLTIRQLLIDLGTEMGRKYKESIWLDNFDERIKELPTKIVIVTDVRFKNEFDHLKDKGFYQIRLYRQTDTVINHISETQQGSIPDSAYDYVLFNNAGLKELKNKVTEIVTDLNKYI